MAFAIASNLQFSSGTNLPPLETLDGISAETTSDVTGSEDEDEQCELRARVCTSRVC